MEAIMATATSPIRLLVVDDCDDAAVVMAILLRRLGHETVVARNGEAALQQAPLYKPDAMFIDLAMPVVDGLTVARKLRETTEFAKTPLVAVSGYVDAEHRALATEAGFTEFLAKPYPLATLELILARLRTRISMSRTQVETMRLAAVASRLLTAQSREGLALHWRTARPIQDDVLVLVEKSGISNILSLAQRADAEELRQWLKNQRCRVGPIFEPTTGRFAFFAYSRRHLVGDLIEKLGGFRVL
jgi:CheY-like chemotaxis protein